MKYVRIGEIREMGSGIRSAQRSMNDDSLYEYKRSLKPKHTYARLVMKSQRIAGQSVNH